MEQNKALYETLFIVRNTIGEEAVKSVIEKFTALITDNGEIDSVNEWGTRHLAYPIDDLTDGYYVLIRFRSPQSSNVFSTSITPFSVLSPSESKNNQPTKTVRSL